MRKTRKTSPDTRRLEAERFLKALDPKAVSWTFQTFDDNKKRDAKRLARVLNGPLAEHWATLVSLNEQGAGIFVTVNETDLKGRQTENITRVRALFCDLDGSPLEPVLANGKPPHIVTKTSPSRWHTYWRITDFPLAQFTDAQKALSELYGSDPKVHDLPRVMRLPGFLHCKGKPFLAHIVSTNDAAPYKPADFPQAQPKATRKSSADQPSEWQQLNSEALGNLSAWVPELFPQAKPYRGGYRVTSKMLQRELEEDLSLVPEGIKDFGVHDMGDEREGKRTPIDIVMEWGKKDFNSAVNWLCEHLGLPAKSQPTNARRAKQIATNIEIGDDITEPIVPTIMTRAEMLDRLVFVGSSGVIIDRANGRMRKKEVANSEYAASLHHFKKQAKAEGKQTDEVMPALKAWLASPLRVSVDTVAWVPGAAQICRPPESIDGAVTAFNSWRGLSPMMTPPGDWEKQAKPFLHHVAYLVPIESECKRFLQWLAHIAQHPEELPHTSYLMITRTTGIGRNLLASIIVRCLRGHVAAGVSLPDLLDGGFTGRLSRKLLAVVDEVREGNSKMRYQRGERLKSLITEEHRHINIKYGTQSVEKNCCRWLMFSNHHDALPFDNTDRRINIIDNPTERKPAEYYEKLFALLDDSNFIASVRQLLMSIDISNFHAGEHAPMNEAKLQALHWMRTDVERAVIEFKEDCTTELASREDIRNYVNDYTNYAINCNHKSVNENQLTHAIDSAGMINARRRINETHTIRHSIVIVRGAWTIESVEKTAAEMLLSIIRPPKPLLSAPPDPPKPPISLNSTKRGNKSGSRPESRETGGSGGSGGADTPLLGRQPSPAARSRRALANGLSDASVGD